jgi:NAD(P)-dependent dehydrogenase (short-subunit alcohol dehydrogenase family)
MTRPLAVVTGASTGLGFELARCCVQDGYVAVVCADEPQIEAGKCIRAHNHRDRLGRLRACSPTASTSN